MGGVAAKSPEVVRLLIDRGADVNYQAFAGHTALHVAAMRGWDDLVSLLLEVGADPEIRDDAGRTAYDWAQANEHSSVMRLLNKEAPAVEAARVASPAPVSEGAVLETGIKTIDHAGGADMTTDHAVLPTTGQDDVFRLTRGYYTTRALLALWRLGLLERAASGQILDAAAIAADSCVDAGQVRPLLDYLVVRGFLEAVAPGRYRLTDRGRAAAPYFGYLSTMVGAYEPVVGRLENLVTGGAVYGRDVVRSHAEMTRGLTALEDGMMGTVVDVVRDAGARRVLDLGCGSARMLARICQVSPGTEGVGVDRDPDSCAVARETVEREGLHGRLTIVQADAGDVGSLPREAVAGVDLVTVMFLLHEILRQRGRDGTVALLRSLAGLVGHGGRLVIVEVSGTSEPSYRENLLFVPEYELLHEYTNQRLAAREEWEAMVTEAGMQVQRFAPVDMCQAFCLVAAMEPAGSGR